MAKSSQRFLNEGINEINGFKVEIIRFVGAQQISETNRKAARYWGTITTPAGKVINLGDSGREVGYIKKICGVETASYNRGGGDGTPRESQEIKKLRQAIATLESMGMDASAVQVKLDELIAKSEEDKKAADAAKKAKSEENKKIKKEIKGLESALASMYAAGLDTAMVSAKIEELKAQIA